MNKEEIEIAEIDEREDEELSKKLDEAKIQYPVWKPNNLKQTIQGIVKEILTFQNLNGKEKHGVLINLQTKNDKYPVVSIWANTVILSNLKRMSDVQIFDSFDTLTSSLKTNEGKMIALRFEGQVKSSIKGNQPYDNYTLVEI